MVRRLVQVGLGSLLGLVIAYGAAWWMWGGRPEVAILGAAQTEGRAAVGGPFRLVDHTGAEVTDETWAGKHRLMFFGFTYCPDICPTELHAIARVMDELGSDADRVQPLFVTIDPERDTPEAMAEYVAAFHPRIVGLTGTPQQVAEVARAYRVFYAKVRTGDGPDDYTMDHSTAAYLMGPDNGFITVFGHGTPPERIAEEIRGRLAAS